MKPVIYPLINCMTIVVMRMKIWIIVFFEWKYEFISSMKRFIDDLRSENVIMLEYLKNRKHTVILNIEAIINWIGNDKITVTELELLKKSICENIVDKVLNIK